MPEPYPTEFRDDVVRAWWFRWSDELIDIDRDLELDNQLCGGNPGSKLLKSARYLAESSAYLRGWRGGQVATVGESIRQERIPDRRTDSGVFRAPSPDHRHGDAFALGQRTAQSRVRRGLGR